jgi:hypothetical protein
MMQLVTVEDDRDLPEGSEMVEPADGTVSSSKSHKNFNAI